LRAGGGEKAAELQAALAEAQANLKDADHKLAARQEHVAKIAAEYDELRKKLEAAEADAASKAEQLKSASADSDRLTALDTQLHDQAEALARAKAQLGERDSELEKAAAEQAKLRSDLRTTEAAREALAREADELRRLMQEMNDANRSDAEGINDRVEAVERQLKEKEDAIAQAELERDELAAQLKDAQAEVQTARAARDAAQQAAEQAAEQAEAMRKRIGELERNAGQADELQRRLEGRDRQIEVAQQQIADLKEELKLEEEERNRAATQLQQARDAETRAVEQLEAAEQEIAELKEKLAEADLAGSSQNEALASQAETLREQLNAAQDAAEQAGREAREARRNAEDLTEQLEKAQADAESAREALEKAKADESALKPLRDENAALKARNEEITRKRDEVLRGLETAVGELDALKEVIAGRDVDLRTARGELAESRAEAEQLRKQLEAKQAEASALAGKSTEGERELRNKLEGATEKRHEAEKALVEAKARLESEQQMRAEQQRRIEQLEDALRRERDQVDKSAPAEALTTLSGQLASERQKWERLTEQKDREAAELQKKLDEAELRENELASQLESVELSQQDVMRAKAVAGQRRAQIERMQSDVEGARRQAKEAETYWKSEMTEFQQEVAAHLQAAENGEEGSDARLQKLMEKLKVGIADKYAKLRRKATRTEKELQQTQDKLAAVERIMAKREEEEARLRKLIEEMEARENIPGAKKPGSKPDTEPKKKPARKKK
jgi:chromosome segregation ATPase